jgi:prepilin-type N-terminal cleavage/methylation domain-containing protein
MNKSLFQNELKPWNQTSGFSLIELLIVLIIISIIIVAALPNIQQNLKLYRVESASGALAGALSKARMAAIKYNRPVWLEINSTNNTPEIWTTNENNHPILINLGAAIQPNVLIESGSISRITFNSLGRNQSNSNVVIALKATDTNFCKSVVVSAAGSIKTQLC